MQQSSIIKVEKLCAIHTKETHKKRRKNRQKSTDYKILVSKEQGKGGI